MTKDDFNSYGIRYFTPTEVTDTGAELCDVKARLIQHLDRFRMSVGMPVRIVKNGLTSGDHVAQEHENGIAADVTMNTILPMLTFYCALNAGFKGIGLYCHGGKWVSGHLDLRGDYAFWIGTKKGHQKKWTYLPLIDRPPV